jgi:hypothetical protein
MVRPRRILAIVRMNVEELHISTNGMKRGILQISTISIIYLYHNVTFIIDLFILIENRI